MNQEILQEILRQDYTKIQQDIISFLKNQISQKKAEGVVFGLSGCIDSATVAYLCGKISEQYAAKAAKHSTVIDNSSYFRMDPDVPLIVPEVNSLDLKNYKKKIL